jgi:two-component system CheB/CheR fusion protein
MAREGLKRDLTSALHSAATGGQQVRRPGLRVKTNGDYTLLNLAIHPVAHSLTGSTQEPLYLVVLELAPSAPPSALQADGLTKAGDVAGAATDADTRIAALQQELRAKEEYLQTANEELETSNEELKSANEEMQSVNEELQSTNEELETSKEELQSVNEELATVNAELQTKVSDLSRANNDMNNLLAGTGIATIFVDHQLRILRFTPSATQVINLIQSDIGRPVGHIVSNLKDYDALVADARTVLDTLMPKSLEVQTATGTWYTMRIQPYRTLENVIEGVVVTFVDITERKRSEKAIHAERVLLQSVMNGAGKAHLVYLDRDFNFVCVNETYAATCGYRPDEMVGKNHFVLYPHAENEAIFRRVRDSGQPFEIHDKPFEFPDQPERGTTYWDWTLTPVVNAENQVTGLVLSLFETTERTQAEEALRKNEEMLRTVLNNS